jgi:pyruvate/2-oxoglutarate dehydrogenase complex dihydrolipoamide dehydrogenase (E3) component
VKAHDRVVVIGGGSGGDRVEVAAVDIGARSQVALGESPLLGGKWGHGISSQRSPGRGESAGTTS